MDENYIYKKEVDWSLLHEGLTIPVEYQIVFGQSIGAFLARGEKKEIRIILHGQTYKVDLKNLKFDKQKYKRKDMYQIRYNKSSELAKVLQYTFSSTYDYLLKERIQRAEGDRRLLKVPEDKKEFLVLYTTAYPDTFIAESITCQELVLAHEVVIKQNEYEFEKSINYEVRDENATIVIDERTVKIRKLNRAIGENLKLLYDFRCQLCGEHVGEKYGANIAEAHHIEPYIKSMNNDAKNQLIVCPNHHRIIHKVEPVFDYKKKMYIYENGLCEKLVLNYHI